MPKLWCSDDTELFSTSYVYFTSWARFFICTLNPVNITLNENLTIQKQNRIISKDRKSCHSKRFIWHGKNYYFCVWIVSCNMSPFKKSLKVTYLVQDCESYFWIFIWKIIRFCSRYYSLDLMFVTKNFTRFITILLSIIYLPWNYK